MSSNVNVDRSEVPIVYASTVNDSMISSSVPNNNNHNPIPEVVIDQHQPPSNHESITEPKVEEIHSPWKKRICILAVLSIVIGAALFVASEQITVVEYACEGVVPSQDDIMNDIIPVCITASVREEVMCLQAGSYQATTANDEDSDSNIPPPRYCHTNLAAKQPDGIRDWYLWWSSSSGVVENGYYDTSEPEPYGPAWRMGSYIADTDNSRYKLPAEEPVSNLPNGTLDWKRWSSREDAWIDQDDPIAIEVCDVDSYTEDDDGIPSVCFVEKRLRILLIAGVAFMALPVGLGLAVFLTQYCAFTYDEAVHGRRHMDRTDNWSIY